MKYRGQKGEREINDLVTGTAQLLEDPPPPAKPYGHSTTADPGILAARAALAALCGVSRQSMWRYAASMEPGWFVFALLGIARSGGNRARALEQLRELIDAEQ
jgi:hypothetical protein